MAVTAPLPSPRDEIQRAETAGSGGRPTGPWLWLVPFVLTAAVTGFGLTDSLLGRDELVTWDMVNRGTGRILATLRHVDAVHGTYYLLMHAWVGLFGDSTVSLRLPSLLAVAGTASVVALLGGRLFGSRAGLTAGTLFSLLPAVSRYGQEARSYAWVMLAVALATLLLLRALDAPRSPWRWAAYALALPGVGLLHLIALSVVPAHVLLIAAHARRDRSLWWKPALALLPAAACLTPLVLLGRSQAQRQLYWVPKPDGWALISVWQDVFASALTAGALITLAVLARSPRRTPLLVCAVWALVPPVVVWLNSHGDVSYFRQVYLLFTLPAWTLLAGAGLTAVCRSWKAAAAVLVALAVLTLPDQARMRQPFEHDAPVPLDYAAAADVVRLHHQPGDAVVYDRESTWKLDGGVQYYLPRGLRMRDVFLSKAPGAIDQLYTLDCPAPARCLKGEQRVWLLTQGNDPDPLTAINQGQADALRAQYRTSWSRPVTGMTVTLLVRGATEQPPGSRGPAR
ncbi:glycosyltransferase family 39 protein [Streptomyces sp. NPDC059688]|uniref:glycosyltransferase family 39 protein n=1 Tax=Streptomyces sp. NPDC059688 TaxID=3346906 RepID=UPI00367C7E89